MASRNASWSCVFALVSLALASGVAAADKPKTVRFIPKRSPPIKTSAELGFSTGSRDDFLTTYRRLGMLPVQLPEQMAGRDDARQLIAAATTRYLERANRAAVPLPGYAEVAMRINRELGGIYDARTGAFKAAVAREVDVRSTREIVAAEHLDGVVTMRVLVAEAGFSGGSLWWDGVLDYSDGGLASGGYGKGWRTPAASGNMPALSLRLQVLGPTGDVVFSRTAGIQPIVYFRDIKPLGMTFVPVDPDDLLKDATRIDRAARVAALPLVRTPADISTYHYLPEIDATLIRRATLPPLPAPRTRTASAFERPREQVISTVHRVALAPVYSELGELPAAVRSRLVERIRQELAPMHWEIFDAPDAFDVIEQHARNVNVYDPYTGERNAADIVAFTRSALGNAGAPPDAVLSVSVVRVPATHRLTDVDWDGVNQNAVTLAPVAASRTVLWWDVPGSQRGSMASTIMACSVQVRLQDLDGNPLYRARGGLQLLQRLQPIGKAKYSEVWPTPIDLAPSDLFTDPTREVTAVHLAVRELVAPPIAQ